MRRILAGLALALLIAAPVTATSASLSVVSIIPDDPSGGIADHGSITFGSDPYKGQPNRILVWQCYAPTWMIPSDAPSSSATPAISKRTGQAKIYYNPGYHWSGGLYCQYWTAWVALSSDWRTPISPVISGSF